jgi:hypothetical protein
MSACALLSPGIYTNKVRRHWCTSQQTSCGTLSAMTSSRM